MVLYHITTREIAATYRKDGFGENSRTFHDSKTLKPETHKGVWFTSEPVYYGRKIDLHRVPDDLAVMEIDIPSDSPGVTMIQAGSVGAYLIEWCVPKDLANKHLRPDRTEYASLD